MYLRTWAVCYRIDACTVTLRVVVWSAQVNEPGITRSSTLELKLFAQVCSDARGYAQFSSHTIHHKQAVVEILTSVETKYRHIYINHTPVWPVFADVRRACSPSRARTLPSDERLLASRRAFGRGR